jgi:polysaccharide export outer membrane protein
MPSKILQRAFLARFALSVGFLAAAPLLAQAPSAGEESIHPGDLVRLAVLREPDLSGEFPVNQYGTVVLPLIGEYDVSRETHRSFRTRVIHDLGEIRQAQDIEVTVLRRVRIVGEVNEAGLYPLDPTMTLGDALALAGGWTELAREGKVELRRGDQVIQADVRLDQRVADSPVRSGDEILVPRRSWLSRNAPAVIGSLAGLIVTVVVTFAAQGNQ